MTQFKVCYSLCSVLLKTPLSKKQVNVLEVANLYSLSRLEPQITNVFVQHNLTKIIICSHFGDAIPSLKTQLCPSVPTGSLTETLPTQKNHCLQIQISIRVTCCTINRSIHHMWLDRMCNSWHHCYSWSIQKAHHTCNTIALQLSNIAIYVFTIIKRIIFHSRPQL